MKLRKGSDNYAKTSKAALSAVLKSVTEKRQRRKNEYFQPDHPLKKPTGQVKRLDEISGNQDASKLHTSVTQTKKPYLRSKPKRNYVSFLAKK